MYIYLITNSINGKQYIGQTVKTPEKRFNEHKADARRRSTSKLNRAFLKYGFDAFSVKPLAVCNSLGELNFLEEALISKYDTVNNGYNIKPGGFNHRCPENVKNIISSVHKGKKLTAEHKEKLRQLRLGSCLPEETKKKIALAGVGRIFTPEALAKKQETFSKNRFFHKNVKYTIEQVKTVKTVLMAQDCKTLQEIADFCGVPRQLVKDIKSGHSWKHIKI